MKTIEEYEKEARDILNKRYGIDPDEKYEEDDLRMYDMRGYPTREITETITQLMLRDLVGELKKRTQEM